MTTRPHKNLIVWQEAIGFVKHIYSLTSKFPEAEKFGLVSQLRRAAVSVPTNIAEGSARNTKKEFIQFLYIASGSLSEVDTLLTISTEINYISSKEYAIALEMQGKISALLNGLIKKLKNDIKKVSDEGIK
ncbi:MAG TPA: four helix bundle protein [Bacteroidia bacterium]|nr:four helix bundle protein [Bacteroidia bacterium]